MPKGNNNISNCPEICIAFCKMSSMSSVNYGRVVLQALWYQHLVNSEPASTIFMWAQIYYNRVRNNFGIIGHNCPCISFLYMLSLALLVNSDTT